MIDIVSGLRRIAEEGYRFAGDAADEIERLRAKIEQMEKQVPICRAEDLRHAEILLPSLGLMPEDKLYALPGAQTQPAPSIPDGVIDRLAALPARITPEQAPAGVRDYCHEAAEGYADGWNACMRAIKEETK